MRAIVVWATSTIISWGQLNAASFCFFSKPFWLLFNTSSQESVWHLKLLGTSSNTLRHSLPKHTKLPISLFLLKWACEVVIEIKLYLVLLANFPRVVRAHNKENKGIINVEYWYKNHECKARDDCEGNDDAYWSSNKGRCAYFHHLYKCLNVVLRGQFLHDADK